MDASVNTAVATSEEKTEMVTEQKPVVMKSAEERIAEAVPLFGQSKTTRAGLKTALRTFGKKMEDLNPNVFPEGREGHVFLSKESLLCTTYQKAVQKVIDELKKKGYLVNFPLGVGVERNGEHDCNGNLTIKSISLQNKETIADLTSKCADKKLAGLLDVLYFILIEEFVATKEISILCPADKDLTLKPLLHVPFLKMTGKRITVIPLQSNSWYSYPFGVMV